MNNNTTKEGKEEGRKEKPLVNSKYWIKQRKKLEGGSVQCAVTRKSCKHTHTKANSSFHFPFYSLHKKEEEEEEADFNS